MRYNYSFTIDRSQAEVLEFHRHPSALVEITPLPITIRLQSAPDPLKEGDEMIFTTWLGPFPVGWRSRIEDVDDTGFIDRQIAGPFKRWVHRHSFAAIDEIRTEARDEIDYALRPHLIWGPVGLGMALGLPVLFLFRGWKTKRILGSK